jgi:very-short-patch-repair endonuclease
MAHTFDRAIEALARKQHGAFNIHQVNRLGGDRHVAKRRCSTGQWIRLARGVYALNGNPPTTLRQMKAAELSVRGAAISGTAAGILHEIPGVRLGRLELSAARNAGRSTLARVRHREPVPTIRVEGIRVTSVAQTLVDLAVHLDHEALGTAIDSALLAGTTSWDELDRAHRTARERRSATARPFGEALVVRDPTVAVPQSVLESKLHLLLDDPRLPPHVRQAPAPWDPTGGERVDVAFPSMRWIIEVDGRAWHARVADFERDRRRDHAAMRIGWGSCRFTAADLDRPGYVVSTLLAVFQRISGAAA